MFHVKHACAIIILNMETFTDWSVLKEKLDGKLDFPRTKRRQIWWCVIGKNIGQEQSCETGYERPVLVIRSFGSIFWGIPITSSDSEGKKAENPLYFKLDNTPYLNDQGEEKVLHGFLALHQMRVYDGRRLKRKLLKIDADLYSRIIKTLTNLLK